MYRTFHKLQPSTNPALASKKPLLTKSPKPKPRIQLTLNSDTNCRFSGEKVLSCKVFGDYIGGPGGLWHQKSRYLPKAPSPRIQLTLNSETACRVPKTRKHSKTETGKLFREFGASRILEFCAFAEKNAVSLANQDCKGALASKKPCLSKNREPKPEFSLR